MLSVRLAARRGTPEVLAIPAAPAGAATSLGVDLADEIDAFLAGRDDPGRAGAVHNLPRPLRVPAVVLLVGIGDGDEAGWRAAGAAVVREARRHAAVTLALPSGAEPTAVRGAAEGALLAAYRFRLGEDTAPALTELTLAVPNPDTYAEALATSQAVADVANLARDLVNTPSNTKSPAWFAAQVAAAARNDPELTMTVRDAKALADEGFGGLLAVGGGSAREPRLMEISWFPAGATTHAVLVGKGITFDTGGIDIKPRDGMKLMRKDMAGAAAVAATALGAAALRLPVRVTALAPLAENMPSGSAYRPGDVVRHYGGFTSEIHSTDAEGRVVLGDTLAYAVARLQPDVLVDLATLTGAARVALGSRTAALYSENDELAGALADAGAQSGEPMWRMPLPDDYVYALESDIADLTNLSEIGAGSVMAALYLREFTGAARDRWAHVDMSAPSWADSDDGELVKGATGWGVRTLLRWFATVSPGYAFRPKP